MRERSKVQFFSWLAIFLAGVVSCAPVPPRAPQILVPSTVGIKLPEQHDAPTQGTIVGEGVSVASRVPAPRAPWEQFPLHFTLQGERLLHPLLEESDAMLEAGARSEALNRLLRLDGRALNAGEREALALRVASLRLSLNDPTGALSSLSRYFVSQGIKEDAVDGRFALLFAYAYWLYQDGEQALAWFSRAYRFATPESGVRESAHSGIRRYLRSVLPTQLHALVETWAADTFVREAIGEEERRRADGGQIDLSAPWTAPIAGAPLVAASQSGQLTLGALLPLTGKFGRIGVALQRGLDLAIESQGGSALVAAQYVDTPDEGSSVTARAQELIGAKANLIVGPVLAEQALAVSTLLRRGGIPMIALTKQPRFPTGEGVYRLGATPQNQITSLLSQLDATKGFTSYGILYPEDPAGREYADAFRQSLRDHGHGLIFDSSYGRSDSNALIAAAQIIEGNRPQALFFPDTILNASRLFGSFRRDAVTNQSGITPLGSVSWDDLQQMTNSRAVLDGAFFVSPFFAGSSRSEVQSFVRNFQGKFNERPDFFAAEGFDLGFLIVDAARRARQEGVSFEEAFLKTAPYHGITGYITIEATGEIRTLFSVVQYSGGQFVELTTADPGVGNGAKTVD